MDTNEITDKNERLDCLEEGIYVAAKEIARDIDPFFSTHDTNDRLERAMQVLVTFRELDAAVKAYCEGVGMGDCYRTDTTDAVARVLADPERCAEDMVAEIGGLVNPVPDEELDDGETETTTEE